ncbi:hypothetical protein VNI00_010793 [Paramarasmius palmivorus]|uniref:Uncharacterized protein n=1 Tax=Paramarasmius palmivorus TaxID=297713 RepID=A0AAW0CFI8_9AGAR
MSRPRPTLIDEETRARFRQYELDLMKPRLPGQGLSSSERSRRYRDRKRAEKGLPVIPTADSQEKVALHGQNHCLRRSKGKLRVIQYAIGDSERSTTAASLKSEFQDVITFEHYRPGDEGVEVIETRTEDDHEESSLDENSPAPSTSSAKRAGSEGSTVSNASTSSTTNTNLGDGNLEEDSIYKPWVAFIMYATRTHRSAFRRIYPASNVNKKTFASIDELTSIRDISSVTFSPTLSFDVDIASSPRLTAVEWETEPDLNAPEIPSEITPHLLVPSIRIREVATDIFAIALALELRMELG